MRVSVLIPTRDRAELLAEAIRSLQRQTVQPLEIIVIDDGSEDSTSEVLESFGPAIRVLRQPVSAGKSQALNRGMESSSGDAIIVLDDDDLFPPRALELHVQALTRFSGADFSYGRLMRFRERLPDLSQLDRTHSDVDPMPIDDGRRMVIKLMEECFLPNPAWMARRSALERAGPYDVGLARSQDFDMILRLARENEGAFVDDIVLLQRHHDRPRPGVAGSTGGRDSSQAWRLYDKRIFERIAQDWPLASFRPFEAAAADRLERHAWLQKGVLLFLRGCSEQSAAAFRQHQLLLQGRPPDEVELAVAQRLFHVMFRNSPPSALLDSKERATLSEVMTDSSWPPLLRSAFAKGGRWHVGAALRRGELASAVFYARFMASLLGTAAVASSFASKLAKAG